MTRYFIEKLRPASTGTHSNPCLLHKPPNVSPAIAILTSICMHQKLQGPSPRPRLMPPPQLLMCISSRLHSLIILCSSICKPSLKLMLYLPSVNKFVFNLSIKTLKKRIKLHMALFLLLASSSPLCNFLGNFLGRVAGLNSFHVLLSSSP